MIFQAVNDELSFEPGYLFLRIWGIVFWFIVLKGDFYLPSHIFYGKISDHLESIVLHMIDLSGFESNGREIFGGEEIFAS